MFLGGTNQYCENDYTTKMQSSDSMQSLSNCQWPFSQNENKTFTIHMETQKTLNSQSSLEKEEWSWRNQPSLTSDYTTKLQSSRQYGTGTKT